MDYMVSKLYQNISRNLLHGYTIFFLDDDPPIPEDDPPIPEEDLAIPGLEKIVAISKPPIEDIDPPIPEEDPPIPDIDPPISYEDPIPTISSTIPPPPPPLPTSNVPLPPPLPTTKPTTTVPPPSPTSTNPHQTSPSQAMPLDSMGYNARAGLMEAIRAVGGMSGAGLKKTNGAPEDGMCSSGRKVENMNGWCHNKLDSLLIIYYLGKGDLLGDLQSKLSLRRGRLSGDSNEGSGQVMRRISTMIPPPSSQSLVNTDDDDSLDEWDEIDEFPPAPLCLES